jgi:two-component system aerobic respiration control sensor histidine kinase ArcB
VTQLALEDVLDTATLQQYVEVIGYDKFLQSVSLFEKLAPTYLEKLNASAAIEDAVSIAQQAHQLKGASGSIGLLRIQKHTQKLQDHSTPEWHKNHLKWIVQMTLDLEHDLKILRAYLKEQLAKI